MSDRRQDPCRTRLKDDARCHGRSRPCGDLLERSKSTVPDAPMREAPCHVLAREGLDVNDLLDRHGEAFDLQPEPMERSAKSPDGLKHVCPPWSCGAYAIAWPGRCK